MRVVLILAAVTAVGTVAACSSSLPVETRPGTLVLGTAQVTVNNADVGSTDEVVCTVAGPLTTITTGNGQSGTTALVSTADTPTAKSVSIRNLGGFTGSYNAGLGGAATVTMIGRSYAIAGTANGFTTSAPAIQTSGTFAINVAC